MANVLTAVTPKLLAMGLLALREAAFMPQIVNRQYEAEAGKQGSTIDVSIPASITAVAVTPGPTPPASTDVTPTSVPITLDQWFDASFHLTDKELKEIDMGILPMEASEAIKALANNVNSYLLGLYKKFYGYVGTAGTTPFASNTVDVTNARKALFKQLAPRGDLRMVIDPDAEANALNLTPFQDTSWSNSDRTIKEALIERKLGFNWFPHQLIPTHTKGTATSITTAVDTAAGSATIILKVASGTGTLVEGDIITIAGQSQTYVVTAGKTLDTTGVIVPIAPNLVAAVDGDPTPVAITLKASHIANLAIHRDAIAFASRPFKNVEPGLGSITETAVDPDSGLTLRLEITREHKQTKYAYDILYGAAVVRRELGCRVAG